MNVDPLPLALGDEGDAVLDVQRRLRRVGFPVPSDEDGRFGEGTAAALERFQKDRGLRTDSTCGAQTWSALVEAGYHLGDRFLYRRTTMLRGEDVAELQERLGSLGFDAGRVDGIFGPDTGDALEEFQRNTGLNVDGICGPDSVAALTRLAARQAGPTSVARVREVERLRGAAGERPGHRIIVGHGGDAGSMAEAVARLVRDTGAIVDVINNPDGSAHAREANEQGAHLYLGLRLTASASESRVAYYSQRNWESVGGHRLADLIVGALQTRTIPTMDLEAVGMRLAVLRETRMPAVSCELGPADEVVPALPEVTRAMADAIAAWIVEPVSG